MERSLSGKSGKAGVPLTDRAALQALARRFRIRPRQAVSQHFILDRSVLERMVAASSLMPASTALEVGPGFGALTEALLATGATVVAVELDERLALALLERCGNRKNLQVVRDDFFAWYRRNAVRLPQPFSIVANLPYHASAHFFQTALAGSVQPERIVVLVQREVAERIAATPGAMSMLAVSVRCFGTPELLFTVPASAFWPEPEVESAVLRITNIHHGTEETPALLRLAKMAFANRRKQLHNSLSAGLNRSSGEVQRLLRTHAIDPMMRPQELSMEQWETLAKIMD